MDNIINSKKETIPPPFQVRTSGMISMNPHHSTPGTKQGDIMLTVFLGGKGTYHTSAGKQKIRRGMVGIVPPYQPGLLATTAEDPYVHLYCRFSGSYAVFLAEKILRRHRRRFFECENFARIAEIVKKMGPLHLDKLPSEMGSRELLLAEALLVLAGNMAEIVHDNISASNLRHYLEANISQPTNLDEMSEHFSVSKATLCRRARKCLGTTIQKYHERIKMEWAKELLKFRVFSIKDIALRVGYQDPLYFSRIFHRHTGKRPSVWLKKNINDG